MLQFLSMRLYTFTVKSLHPWCQVRVRRCQGLKIFCCLKKKSLFVGILNMLILSVSHYLLHTCFLGFVSLCVCVCVSISCTVVKSPCRQFSYWNSLLVIVFHACKFYLDMQKILLNVYACFQGCIKVSFIRSRLFGITVT